MLKYIAKFSKNGIVNRIKFNNEIFYHKLLSNKNFGYFTVTKLVAVNNYSFLTVSVDFEAKGFGSHQLYEIMHSYYLLSINDSPKHRYNVFFSPIVSFLKSAFYLFIHLKVVKAFEGLIYLFVYLFSTAHLKKTYFIHKDLCPRERLYPNALSTESLIYIFDFETSTVTSKFFLSDIVDFFTLVNSDFMFNEFSMFLDLYIEKYNIDRRLAYYQLYILLYRRIRQNKNNKLFQNNIFLMLNKIKMEHLR